jgi:hypothetical protein
LISGQQYEEALVLLRQAEKIAVCVHHLNRAGNRISAIQSSMPREVPRLIGLSLDEAREKLRAENLRINEQSAGQGPIAQKSPHRFKDQPPKPELR